MARIGYIPYDAVREEEKELDKRERRAMRNCAVDDGPTDLVRFGPNNPKDAEFESVEALAEFLMDNDQELFDHTQVACVNFRTGIAVVDIKRRLEDYGLRMKERPKVVRHRGVSDNPHDRWSAYPT